MFLTILDVLVAVVSFVSATYWLSSAVKTMYAKDTNRPPEERELLIELSQNRNMRAALAASFAAYLIAMKYIYMALSDIGVGGPLPS